MKNIIIPTYRTEEWKELSKQKDTFIIKRYDKRNTGEWILESERKNSLLYYLIAGKLYYRCKDTLIALNMDFESSHYGACYTYEIIS